uniref:MIT domain-containing protein 1 n=1 Tax=Acartia pacifica TaxID=335913 RepID=A0A0U2IG43_ACAPC|nr:MIT domain-containing protein 1 [Acartia pacifica]
MVSSEEAAAIALLKRAVELDTSNRYTEAVVCYKEGIQIFLTVVQGLQDKTKKARYREKASEYLERCENLDAKIRKDKEAGKFHEHIKIQAGSAGHGYETLFGRFLDDDVTSIEVDDPYIRAHHQIVNFLRCCELFVKKCSKLKEIKLKTSYDENNKMDQESKLAELRKSLEKRNTSLLVEYSSTLHDREIRLNTGWIIKIGRGLDIFRAPEGKIVLGYFDLDLRPCLETTVDIFYKTER